MKTRTFEARKWQRESTVGASVISLLSLAVAATGHAADSAKPVETASPIKHLIVIIGENRSFDHVFATYQPKHGQSVANLLSKRIIRADGSPGPNFAQAGQFSVSPRASYYISADRSAKTPFAFLPPPDLNGVPLAASDVNIFPPFGTIAKAAAAEPDLEPEDLVLLTTGAATGLSFTPETGGIRNPDTRIANVTRLPNGPFQLTGPTMPYDAYTEDTIHRFYQMWQQTDCATDQEHATRANPTGCLSDGKGHAISPSAAFGPMLGPLLIANPNPVPATNNKYLNDGFYTNCSDLTQPGAGPILDYLNALSYAPSAACDDGHFYLLNNLFPGFHANGAPNTGNARFPILAIV